MTKGMCSSWISIFGFEDQKHNAKYSLNALRARSTRRARSRSSFSLLLMAVEYAFGRIAARHRFAAKRLRTRSKNRIGSPGARSILGAEKLPRFVHSIDRVVGLHAEGRFVPSRRRRLVNSSALPSPTCLST